MLDAVTAVLLLARLGSKSQNIPRELPPRILKCRVTWASPGSRKTLRKGREQVSLQNFQNCEGGCQPITFGNSHVKAAKVK